MSSKKYEFTEETKEFCGKILHRIKALKDFGDVRAGDLGGFIEKEENLSHYDTAWVYGNATVRGDAIVCDYAQVYGNATVCGCATISGGIWEKSPLYIQGTRWSFYMSSDDTITVGCQTHTFKQWHEKYREIAKEHNALDIISEYILYFNLACVRYGKDEFVIEAEKKVKALTA